MNIEVVAQLTMLALILISGPLIVGIVALRDGDMQIPPFRRKFRKCVMGGLQPGQALNKDRRKDIASQSLYVCFLEIRFMGWRPGLVFADNAYHANLEPLKFFR